MEKKKIVVTDYIEPDLEWEKKQLAGRDVDFRAYQLKSAPLPDLIKKVRDADMIIVNMAPINRQVIEALEKCRLIVRHGVGYDNVDVSAATEKGIRVGYAPDYCLEEVAEQAIMLIFACWRKIFQSRKVLEQSSRAGIWDFEGVRPIFSLGGKNLGIVGCGRIGSLVLKKLSGFAMNPLICDPYLSEERKRQLGTETVELEKVLKEADIITLHVPLNEETHHMIGERELRMMKKTAVLVNTSRGPVIDFEALTRALREGWIAGAGIDVYGKEPPPPDMELFRLERATLTPHLAWYSEEAGWSIRQKLMEDIERFLAGKPPRFLVNKELLKVTDERRGARGDRRLGINDRRSGADQRVGLANRRSDTERRSVPNRRTGPAERRKGAARSGAEDLKR
jgi:D-3-phosphoglycerate dehydrogenase